MFKTKAKQLKETVPFEETFHAFSLSKAELRKRLEDALPPLVPRHGIKEKYGIPYSDGYLANQDSVGMGAGAIRVGNRVCYEKSALIEWLLQRIA
ncbi:MAG: hypothetical protein A4E65_03033 [Syntrophorhabdus sp. PtaU1.Bin153]|nr:MAG: hypothetical protein A4E65_03033 [Syntrophorhabdus sp. PtaU1.Bin153]